MFKSIEFLLTILACALTSAWADVFRLGRCPQVKLQRDFKSSLVSPHHLIAPPESNYQICIDLLDIHIFVLY